MPTDEQVKHYANKLAGTFPDGSEAERQRVARSLLTNPHAFIERIVRAYVEVMGRAVPDED